METEPTPDHDTEAPDHEKQHRVKNLANNKFFWFFIGFLLGLIIDNLLFGLIVITAVAALWYAIRWKKG